MVLRMLMRWAEGRGFAAELLEVARGRGSRDQVGDLPCVGENAYGLFGAERGVHRLVRLSPFDSAHRRQTSFAGVEVAPVVKDTGEVEINEDDLQVDTYRASGAGGQHVNKTDSAVRITHRPSGIVVQCQNERSQSSNSATAMAMLRAKLLERKERERQEEIAREKGEAQDVNFGSQIRSYVLHPYTMAKDHRTGTRWAMSSGCWTATWTGSSGPSCSPTPKRASSWTALRELVAARARRGHRPGRRDDRATVGEQARARALIRRRHRGSSSASRRPRWRSPGSTPRPASSGWPLRVYGARRVRCWRSGAGRALLTAERTALNFLAHLSGVATMAARAARAVEGSGARVLDTRKTTPGLRALEKAAVRAGGAVNHRAGLYDAILIKENHIAAAGGIAAGGPPRTGGAPELAGTLEVEVRNPEEIDEALEAGAPRLLLDNMDEAAARGGRTGRGPCGARGERRGHACRRSGGSRTRG